MVCKEEILTWFKDLDSYKRIDMLCELLTMCVPFEQRFIGSYLEEIGKHSYSELRQQSLSANDIEKLEKDTMFKNQSLFEEAVRHRMLLNISLLKSRNYSVANWYSKKFLRTDYIEDLIHKEKNEEVHNELLLLFTMAARHPAFNFDQKQFFTRILVQLYELRDCRFIKSGTYTYPPGFGYPTILRKVPEAPPLPINFAMHPPGLPHIDYFSYFRGWPGFPCGAPPEVPPFPPHQPPLHPPKPSTSPLVSSPSQSRSASPHRTPLASRPPTLNILPTPAPTVTIPPVPPAVVVSSVSGIPAVPTSVVPPLQTVVPGPTGALPIPPPSVASVPTMVPVPIEALAPPPLSQSSQQPSPVFNQVKQGQPDCDELNTNTKEEPLVSKPPTLNPWMGPPPNNEIKHINGIRLPSQFPSFPPSNIRSSIVDQMQTMTLTDESSHYHSSSSNSSPLQTPPDTPSNLPSNTSTPHGPGRGPMDKNRVNGLPNYMPPFGDTTSPPPPAAFTFPAFAAMPPNRFYTNAGFRPAPGNTAGFGQYPPPAQYQGQGSTDNPTSFPTYSIPYFNFMYSSYPPANPLPPRNQPPGCYNCGAPSHVGQDCTQQNIEEITQKKTYSVDFSPVPSDGEK